jgi:oligopeptide/dipeptide ABC transporter ATP-binding protein
MLLSVRDLSSYFFLDEGVLRAVDGVSFDIDGGETVALVGESGCGKTIVALSLLRLLTHPGRIVSGEVLFDGEDVLRLGDEALRQVRGRDIGIVFQEPGAALNPVYPVGSQIAEVLRVHRGLSRWAAEQEAVRLLGDVGIPEPEQRARSYPFELSGGMKQRAVIALATCTRPRLLIADEPTTALDVTVQAEILELLRGLQERDGMAILVISHDLGVVAQLARRVMVMYTGRILEVAPTLELFRAPRHPYSRGLIDSAGRMAPERRKQPLSGIPGAVPDFLALPSGCTFRPRCPLAAEECAAEAPPLRAARPHHLSACHFTRTAVPAGRGGIV